MYACYATTTIQILYTITLTVYFAEHFDSVHIKYFQSLSGLNSSSLAKHDGSISVVGCLDSFDLSVIQLLVLLFLTRSYLVRESNFIA